MARTPKTGLDYFSHDVNMASDRKIKLLKAKNGLVGYAVYIRLLEEAYRESGYYLECSDEFDLLFASDNNLDIDVYINVVNDCINYKLFDRDLYDEYKILTSKRMQKNFFDATTRRQKVEVYKEYLLVDFDKCDINSKNVYINSLNVDINSNNESTGTQRKVKESKEEEIRENINDDIEVFFEKCWSLYPKKRGKGSISKSKKKELFKLGERLVEAINGYKKEIKQKNTEEQFILNGSTFFNTRYLDYLVEEKKPIKKLNPEDYFVYMGEA